MTELEQLFGRFQRSEQRRRLFTKLQEYVAEVRSAGWGAHVIVDGSFVMAAIDEPADIDVILALPEDWDMTSEVRPFEYSLISRSRTRKRYGFDVFAVRAGSSEERTMLEFFQQVNVKWNEILGLPSGLKKGIVRIVP